MAPLALVACAIALFVILVGSDAGEDGSSSSAAPAGQTTGTPSRADTQREQPQRRNYTVKAGDSLDVIAERFGIEVERLQELNPEVDPQGLVIGQKIKLRE